LAQRAQQALNQGHLDDAARLYRQALRLHPRWAEGWGYLAGALYQLQRYPEARDAYRQTTMLTPKNGPSWALLGLCEYELRDYSHAFDHLFKAERLGLGSDRDLTAQVKYHLAILWNTAGQFEMGLREILWFAQQNLGSPEIIEVIGLSVLRIPDFPEELAQSKVEMVMLAGQAGFAANAQKLDLAQQYYDQLEAKYPTQPNVHYSCGLFVSNHDLDAALKEYEKEIEINPTQPLARVQAAFLYLKMGQQDKALQYAQEASRLDPRNPAAHNLAGRSLMDLNRTPEAIPELALAVRLAPQNSSFHLNLARAYQKSGNKPLAAKEMAAFNQLESKKTEAVAPQRQVP
jgi:tetratricopeptide (TPR) repeat protein